MKNYICTTCGTQFTASAQLPDTCPICEDERQYVNPAGQQWTTLEELQAQYHARIKKKEEHLYGVGMTPDFGISQRALLVQTNQGNVLWDCISLMDNTMVDLIGGLGGLSAIVISHPHYYTTMIAWSKAFGDIPVYLHEADRQWVMRPDDNIEFWSGESMMINDEITIYNLGGHFEGGTVLHWSEGAEGKGALLTGDILQVVSDRKHVSFMYSYPNMIPLPAQKVKTMNRQVQQLEFNRIYGAWWDRSTIPADAKQAVDESARRYINAVS